MLDIATTARFMQRDQLPKTQKGKEWLSEACFAATEQMFHGKNRRNGEFDPSRGTKISNADIDAYGVGCERNTMLNEIKRQVPILNDDEVKQYSYGVHARVAAFVDTSIDTILDSEEAVTLAHTFIEKHDELLIQHGVDLWRIFNAARNTNAAMIEKLHLLVKDHNLGELIEGVLQNVFCIEKLDTLFMERKAFC